MSYNKLLKKVAKEHKTSKKQVDTEIRKAIKMAGYDIEPDEFIAMLTLKVKNQIK